ncbi:non-structural maintenance of chromosomes element 3 homolog [Palaemon carinicauda]|uniref:non-structural maintenance of chromosomes element 3 homolog n=1 Tax=Palaemon carinicauda TaxID=392227 RepID=UPI0035B664AA
MPRMLHLSDSEEEEEYTQASSQDISDEEKKHLAGKVANYLLLNEYQKIPSKAQDIRKLVLKEKSRHFNHLIKKASELLEKVYGYKVADLDKKGFILINTVKISEGPIISSVSNNDEIIGLLTVILTGIFMSGGVMHEGQIKEYLKNFKIDLEVKTNHPVFGNIDKLLHQDLRKQCYIDITYDKSVEPPTREYRWGERAHLELSKKNVLELVCKVYGNNMRPEMWTSQWHAIEKENGNQN